MPFTNVAVDLESLPRFEEAPLRCLEPRYARLVLGVALLVSLPVLIGATLIVFLVPPIPLPLRIAIECGVLGLVAAVTWLPYQWVRRLRYAVREHDVIRRSGLFWTKETVQPIKRIQHVEQEQGPLDKRFGLSTIKLYSAGTGNVTLRIPGLDTETSAALSRFILSFHEPGARDPQREPEARGEGASSDG